MNCTVCNVILLKECSQFEIFYTLTSHSRTPFSKFIKRLLQWDLNETHSRFICKQCFDLLEELDYTEVTCLRLKKQIYDRCPARDCNTLSKDASCQTENTIREPSPNLLSYEETKTFLNQISEKTVEQKSKPYECNHCPKKFVSKTGLLNHEQKQHIEKQQPVQESELKLECDVVIADSGGSNEVKCELEDDGLSAEDPGDCPTPAPQTEKRRKNSRNWSSLKPAKYQCPQCPKMWRTAGELRTHEATHSQLRPYICEICGQAYKHKQALDIHVGMHNGINPFSCQYCNKAFTQKGALQRHLPIHTGEAPYQCDLCGKRFVHHTSFNMHTLAHTGQKDYKCEICGLALLSNSHLKRHSRVHTGEKPYACSHCGKCFAERYNLAAHQKLHENLLPGTSNTVSKRSHRCQVCDATFDRKTKLEEHLSSNHNKISDDQEPRKWIGHFLGNVGA